jgi:penicillin-binding protein 1C
MTLKIPKVTKRLLVASGLFFLLLLSLFVLLFSNLPDPTQLTTNPSPASTKLLDRHGQLIYEIYSEERRTPVPLSSLPKEVKLATLAAEDKDFYSHIGISLRGVSRAFLNTFFKGDLQGGSTITQQLVKKAFLNDDRTLIRKARELVLSLLVEIRYSKDQILEFYLNQVPYGGTAYGIESASQTYFRKPASQLNLAEAALLAGLPQAPSYYSPFGTHPEYSIDRQKYVLNQMLSNKFISQQEYDQALIEPLHFSPPDSLKAPHFSLWVKDLLLNKYGADTIYSQGLVVTTTLDLSIQELAQSEVATEIAKLAREKVSNGAALVTSPKTGEILAMVGSTNYYDTSGGGNVNVTLRPRQPGSSIKPLTYALGIDRGLFTASSVLSDKPTCFSQPNQKIYCPTNYDHAFHGPTQVRFALANSFNIPAVKALTLVGLSEFVNAAKSFGITTFNNPENYGPSITLGGAEVTMLDLSTAYSALANSGRRVDLNPILHIQDRTGKVIESVQSRPISNISPTTKSFQVFSVSSRQFIKSPPPDTRVIAPGTSFIISHLLLDNGARSAVFGNYSLLNVAKHPEVSVKTGTTNDKRDNWTIGYNPDVLVSVWVGNNDNSPMSNVASGITGASPIWNKVITQILKNYPPNWPIQSPDIVGKLVCSTTGQLAPDPAPGDCPPRYEYFLRTFTPPIYSPERKDVAIYRPTQAFAPTSQVSQEPTNIDYQNHAVITDPLGTTLCLDCSGGYGQADTIFLDRFGRASKH